MRVLWFTSTPSLFKEHGNPNNGAGWISSLEKAMINQPNITLGVSFFANEPEFKITQNNTTYYPIALYNTLLKKIRHVLFFSKYDAKEVEAYLTIIEDFKPDVIHIFGSEKSFGLISYHTDIPIVIHLQGLLLPYMNAWFPPGVSNFDCFRYMSITKFISYLKKLRLYNLNARREELILAKCPNFMGRTTWDKNVTKLYGPNSKYFYCSEVLRTPFYTAEAWQPNNNDTIEIVTTISQNVYKGFDLVLKTASLLKAHSHVKFRWRVYGISSYTFWEKKLKLSAKSLNVEQLGVVKPNELISALQQATAFVHPSYIDNSPNSVCEAQLIGVPVIATDTGGVSSLIQHNYNGILVPANDPFTVCSSILKLFLNKEISKQIGESGRKTALERHDINTILRDNINTYMALLN